jgi:hypothetical protein
MIYICRRNNTELIKNNKKIQQTNTKTKPHTPTTQKPPKRDPQTNDTNKPNTAKLNKPTAKQPKRTTHDRQQQ